MIDELKQYTTIILDFACARVINRVEARQNDINSRFVRILPCWNGTAMNVADGIAARAEYLNSANEGGVIDCNISNSEIILELKDVMLSKEDVITVSVVLYKNESFLSSQDFYVDVKARLLNDSTQMPDVPGITVHDAIAKIDTKITEAEKLLTDASAATTAATTAAAKAEQAIADISSSTVERYGVRFEGSANSGATVKRLYNAFGLVAGVGTDTEAAVNDFDKIYPWSARRRCCGYFDEAGNFVVNAYAGEPGYTTDGSNGEVWVEHSLFYYKHTYDGDAEEIIISAFPIGGFLPAPIFVKSDGTLIQKAYTAAYPMATVDGKATSRSGVFSDSCSLNSAMDTARTLGENYTTTTTAEWYTECLYMWVEFATRDMQTVMCGATYLSYVETDTAVISENGANRIIVATAIANKFVVRQTVGIGRTIGGEQIASNRIVTAIEEYDAENKAICFDGEPVNITTGNIVYSTAYINGSCDEVLSSSGSPTSNVNGKYNCVYRGKETPYGNAFEWISDILVKVEGEGTAEDSHSYDVYYLPDPTKYSAGNITADYVKLNFKLPTTDGYLKKFGFDSRYPHLRLPVEIGASSATWYSDRCYYPRNALCAASVGNSWSGGLGAGPCCWYCSLAPSVAGLHRHARLSFHRT